MLKILITGATGFIGSHLVRHLQGRYELFLLYRKRADLLHGSGGEWLEADISNPLDSSRLPDKIDIVIHLAQSRFYRQFPDKAADIFNVNARGTFHLLEYARRVKAQAFLCASSGSVYGYGSKRFVEADPAQPNDFYGISKRVGELLLQSYETFFRTVIFRLFFVYGPGEKKMLIPSFIEKVRTGKTITIEGDSGLRVNPIYVKDAVRAFESAVHQPVSGIFNIAGDEVVNFRDLIGLIEEVVNRKAVIHHLKDQRQGDLLGDNTRMKKLLNVLPETPLHEGLRRMVE